MQGRRRDKFEFELEREIESWAPPSKRARLIERNTPQISSSASESISTHLRDWMSWIASSTPISWITSNAHFLSRIFSRKRKNREMATNEPRKKGKKWKIMKKQDREDPVLTRMPIHNDDIRWKSLKEMPQMRDLSSGNPFYGQSVRPTVNPVNIENVPPSPMRLRLSYQHSSSSCEAAGREVPPPVMQKSKPKSKRTMRTALQTIKLDEKEQYRRLLLNQCSQNYGSSVVKPPVYQSRGTQMESPSTSSNPYTSAFSHETLSAESKKNMTKWLKVGGDKNLSETQIRENWLKPIKTSESAIDSDLEITKVELPMKKKLGQVSSKDSHLFSGEWIEDLKRTISIDTKDTMRLIHEQERKAKLMQEKREARLSSENLKLFQRVRQTTVLPESPEASDEEEDASQYPELASDMDAKVEDALRPSPPDEILVEGFQLSVTRRDMETLSGLNWLNDEIINFYMNMLMERGKMDNFPSVYAFNTFFYPKLISSGHSALKRWTRKVDIFSYNFILIPVHLGMHWCLAVIDLIQKKIQYYDSMGGQNNECLNALCLYLKEECLDKKKTDFDMNDWKMEAVKNIPHQMNGSDCGMFALKYAEYITRNSKITFTQAHMPYFRRRMVYEILMKQLL